MLKSIASDPARGPKGRDEDGCRVMVPELPRWDVARACGAFGWLLGMLLIVAGVWCVAEWSAVRREGAPDTSGMVQRATRISEAGDLQGAIELLSTVIGLDPANAAAHLGRSRCRLKLKEHAGAIADARRAGALGADRAEVALLIARATTGMGAYREALGAFDAALAAGADRQEVLLLRGAVHDELGNPEKACGDFDELIRLNPLQSLAFLLRAQARSRLGRFDLALADYDLLPKHVSDSHAAQLGRGVALLGLRRWDEALACFERALERNAGLTGAWRGKAAALEAVGRGTEAAEAWQQAGNPPLEDRVPLRERGLQAEDVAWFLRPAGRSVAGSAAGGEAPR